MCNCSICNKEILTEEPKILVMGAYGMPKYLCDECSRDIDEVTLGKDYETIAAAMDRVGEKLSCSNPDNTTFMTVNSIMEESAERAKLIKEGKYDFALDEEEADEEGFDEIPEELKETEEDRALDEADAEREKKFDTIYNILVAVLSVAFVVFLVWRILDVFVFR